MRKFIANKYDIMVRKLQFADKMNQSGYEFQSVEVIVNFICEKMADSEDDDLVILIPEAVKQSMKDYLIVENGKLYQYYYT